MDREVYDIEAETEATHWWFRGRRALFAAELRRAGVEADAAVLDVGTGTGANLRMLKDSGFSKAIGLDMSADALKYCAEKGLGRVEQGSVLAMPFPDESFDLVLATDIIEHVDDDSGAMREIVRVLKPGGQVLATVPAFRLLWGPHDHIAHHKRRYRLDQFREVAHRNGLKINRAFYFNFILFIPILCVRKFLDKIKTNVQNENQINTPTINKILNSIFHLDVRLAPRIRPPFGVSAFIFAQKQSSP